MRDSSQQSRRKPSRLDNGSISPTSLRDVVSVRDGRTATRTFHLVAQAWAATGASEVNGMVGARSMITTGHREEGMAKLRTAGHLEGIPPDENNLSHRRPVPPPGAPDRSARNAQECLQTNIYTQPFPQEFLFAHSQVFIDLMDTVSYRRVHGGIHLADSGFGKAPAARPVRDIYSHFGVLGNFVATPLTSTTFLIMTWWSRFYF